MDIDKIVEAGKKVQEAQSKVNSMTRILSEIEKGIVYGVTVTITPPNRRSGATYIPVSDSEIKIILKRRIEELEIKQEKLLKEFEQVNTY